MNENNTAVLTVSNSTFTGNSPSDPSSAADILNDGNLNLTNTILAGVPSGKDLVNYAKIGTAQYNLIQYENGTDIQNGAYGNIVGPLPDLGLLAYNGGPTQTVALLVASLPILSNEGFANGGFAALAA